MLLPVVLHDILHDSYSPVWLGTQIFFRILHNTHTGHNGLEERSLLFAASPRFLHTNCLGVSAESAKLWKWDWPNFKSWKLLKTFKDMRLLKNVLRQMHQQLAWWGFRASWCDDAGGTHTSWKDEHCHHCPRKCYARRHVNYRICELLQNLWVIQECVVNLWINKTITQLLC